MVLASYTSNKNNFAAPFLNCFTSRADTKLLWLGFSYFESESSQDKPNSVVFNIVTFPRLYEGIEFVIDVA